MSWRPVKYKKKIINIHIGTPFADKTLPHGAQNSPDERTIYISG